MRIFTKINSLREMELSLPIGEKYLYSIWGYFFKNMKVILEEFFEKLREIAS